MSAAAPIRALEDPHGSSAWRTPDRVSCSMDPAFVPAATAPLSDLEPAALYRGGIAFVRRALAQLGVPAADVDDMAHEVFITLQRKGLSFSCTRAARAWLWAAARRHASNHRRARTRAASRVPAWSPSEPCAPDRAVEDREAAAIVEVFASELTQPARAVFELSEVAGLSVPEVAETLGLKLNTTYSHVRRVRGRLARTIAIVLGLILLVAAMLREGVARQATGRRA
jgi:RNA polymerase sigma-70 factor (ECF subfamily)